MFTPPDSFRNKECPPTVTPAGQRKSIFADDGAQATAPCPALFPAREQDVRSKEDDEGIFDNYADEREHRNYKRDAD
jgi:hypothetical protein